MKEFAFQDINWQLIRQTLSLSLLSGEPVLLKGACDYVAADEDIIPVYKDLKNCIIETGAGILTEIDGDMAYRPESLKPGTFYIAPGKFTPVSEIELFFIPALFACNFRSVIHYEGVTHSHLSYSTTFLKETLFGLLEKTGHYASMNLKRFGFYGSGGGIAESRIYPAEPRTVEEIFRFNNKKIEGVRILVSGMNMEIAAREKEFVKRNLSIDDNRISTMEIADSSGFGNSIQIYAACDDINFILSRDMEFYNSNGDFIFDESLYYNSLSDLIDKCGIFMKNNTVPISIQLEVIPYLYMTKSPVPSELKETSLLQVCRELL